MPDLIRTEQDGLTYFQSPQLLAYPRVRHGFFTRLGGISTGDFASLNFRFTGDDHDKVMRNYAIAAQVLGGSEGDIVRTNQQHTDCIEVVTEHPSEFKFAKEGAPVDALMTNVCGVILTGFYADCQLLMLYDHKVKAVAVVHAGWRGVKNEIARKTIEKMSEVYGTRTRDLECVVGPSICRSCFETDDDVYEALSETFGEKISDFVYRQDEKWHIDLKNITYSSLISAGIPSYNIDISSICPCCGDRSLWWSHRRQGNARGVHAGMIMLV